MSRNWKTYNKSIVRRGEIMLMEALEVCLHILDYHTGSSMHIKERFCIYLDLSIERRFTSD